MSTTATPSKNRQANEFRAKADALRAELADASVTLTKDEIEARVQGIKDYDARAAYVAEFTPDATIARQGGDAEVRALAPETRDDNTLDNGKEYDALCRVVKDAFGGPNGYLRAIAQDSRGVRRMSDAQIKVHERAQAFSQRSTVIGTAADASGGEFLLPLQQVADIFRIPNVAQGILGSARKYPVAGRTLRIPYLVQNNPNFTRPMGGIGVPTYVGENTAVPESEPTFAQRLLTVYKVGVYSELSDEVLADDLTGQLAPAVQQSVGGTIMNFIDEQVTIDGTGTSQMTGALAAGNGSVYSVTRNTVSKVLVQDIFEMHTRAMKGPNTAWYAHPSVLPQLYALTLNGTTLVTFVQNLNAAPTLMLLGLPVIVTPMVSLLGSAGDLAILNGDFYAAAIRMALSVESSIHFKFQNDVTAYRFLTRAGGIPIPTAPYSYKAAAAANTYSVSPFVKLV